MRKILIFLIFLFALSSITGCATMINKKMASWMGHNVNDLIASWGPPQQTMSDGQGGQILIYSQTKQWTTPGQSTTSSTATANVYGNVYSAHGYGTGTSRTTYDPPQTYGYNAQRMFWVDSNGRIYRWAWRGL